MCRGVNKALGARRTTPRWPLLPRRPAAKLLNLRTLPLVGKTTLLGGARRLGGMAHLGRDGTADKLSANLLQTELTVAILAARLATDHDDARWLVRHAYGGVGGVDALPARTRGVKRLGHTLACKVV